MRWEQKVRPEKKARGEKQDLLGLQVQPVLPDPKVQPVLPDQQPHLVRRRGQPLRNNSCSGLKHAIEGKAKTDGRVVRLLTKHLAAEDRAVEQWFLVAIGDDEKAKERISTTAKGGNEVVEVIGNIPLPGLPVGV